MAQSRPTRQSTAGQFRDGVKAAKALGLTVPQSI
jgi:hypothetical protein